MGEELTILLLNGFILMLLLLMQILIPNISRKNILLGVKIPEEKMATSEVKEIIKGFKRENIFVGIPTLIILLVLINYFDSVVLISIAPVLYLGVLFAVYIRWNRKSKELKKEKEWDKLASNIIFVDTKFSRDKTKYTGISKKWILIPLVIILFNIGLSVAMFPSLPDKIPTHWDFQGNIDGYMNKSIFVAMMMPMVQMLMSIIIYFSYYSMTKSKQQIDPNNPEVSLRKNIIFRKVWSVYFLIVLVLLEILFTVSNMMILGLINDPGLFNIMNFLFMGIIIISSIIISVKIGQGGDRINIKGEKEASKGYDIDDDRLWKLGNTIYFNPEDPSLFVEKRIGVGWTVNGGRPLGVILLLLPFIIIAITLLLVR